MNEAILTQTRNPENLIVQSVDTGLGLVSDAALMYGGVPGVKASNSIERMRGRIDTYGVHIVLIIAVAVILAIGIMAYVAIVCIRRGGSYQGGLSAKTNGWRVWQAKLQFNCSQ